MNRSAAYPEGRLKAALAPAFLCLVLGTVSGAAISFGFGMRAAHAETMSDALARAYANNTTLNQQRAGVRATDETVPQATAAYRPTVTAHGQFGLTHVHERSSGLINGTASSTDATTDPGLAALTVTETVFNGNRNYNGVRQAESNVLSARENLRNTEENTLLNGATFYMNV